jgi:hypothetical protein
MNEPYSIPPTAYQLPSPKKCRNRNTYSCTKLQMMQSVYELEERRYRRTEQRKGGSCSRSLAAVTCQHTVYVYTVCVAGMTDE